MNAGLMREDAPEGTTPERLLPKVVLGGALLTEESNIGLRLKEWGYEVTHFPECEQLIDFLRESKSSLLVLVGQEYSDVFLDYISGGDRFIGKTLLCYSIIVGKTNKNEEASGALEKGADDYINVPLSSLELRSRLRVGERVLNYEVKLQEKNKQLQKYGEEMSQLSEERAQQLMHSYRISTLGHMSTGLAKDINESIQGIQKVKKGLDIHLEGVPEALKALSLRDAVSQKKVDFIAAEMSEILKGINHGVERVSKIVSNLENCSQRKSDPFWGENISLDTVVNNALLECHEALGGNVEVLFDAPSDLPSIGGNACQLEQVFVNLIVNSLHAMEGRTDKKIILHMNVSEGHVITSVKDSGCGISDTSKKYVFDSFFTTKEGSGGSGLGLSISQKIISEHKGTIDIDNCNEGGACCVVRLPIMKMVKTH